MLSKPLASSPKDYYYRATFTGGRAINMNTEAVTSDGIKVGLLSILYSLADNYMIMSNEAKRLSTLTGHNQPLISFGDAAQYATQHYLNQLLREACNPEGSSSNLTVIEAKPSWYLLDGSMKLFAGVSGVQYILNDLRREPTYPLIYRLLDIFNTRYPFDIIADEINAKVNAMKRDLTCSRLLALMHPSKATIKDRGVIFTEIVYSDIEILFRSYKRFYESLDAVAVECEFEFGTGLGVFADSLANLVYTSGEKFGDRPELGKPNHIKINTFQKHVRMTLTHQAFDAITAYIISNGNDSQQENAFKLIELLAECAN